MSLNNNDIPYQAICNKITVDPTPNELKHF